MESFSQELQEIFSSRFKEQESLSQYTNFRIGGPAKWFVETISREEIIKVIDFAKQYQIPFFILGGGSNVLVSDKGFDGLIIKFAHRSYKIEGTVVTADAGVLSAFLSRKLGQSGLSGLEWAITLPGTIGGAVRGNAGCFGGEMKDCVESVSVYRNGEVIQLSKEELHFSYRHSIVKETSDSILGVTLHLHPGDKNLIAKKMEEVIGKRKSTQPTHAGSAGCLFKNYEIKKEKDLFLLKQQVVIPEAMLERGQISCGWLIDNVLGLTGTKIGDAQISHEHGNFVLNLGNATADEVMQLIAYVKTQARNRCGIELEEEVQLIGFH